MTKRLNLLVGGIAVAIVAVVAAIIIINPFASHPATSAERSPSPAPEGTTTVSPSQAPVPPDRGAYFGAWVGPDIFTQANEINAVDTLQQQIGRKLQIIHALRDTAAISAFRAIARQPDFDPAGAH
jgi:hypothetical protein